MTTATKSRNNHQQSIPPQKQRKVAILGYAEETRELVFGLDEDAEVWGINMAHAFIYKVKDGQHVKRDTLRATPTAWFQLHPRDWSSVGNTPTGYFGRQKEHLEFLQQFDGDLWLQKADPEIPNGKVFPLEKIAAASGRTYFTSTFAYQLGLLWYQHTVEHRPVGDLHVFGVNLTSLDEYTHQKPCVEYWLGRLEQEGVRVHIPAASGLLKGRLYARSENDLSDHAFERLQHFKKEYGDEYANFLVGETMRLDGLFWASKLQQWAKQFPESFKDENLRREIEATVDRRGQVATGITQKAFGALNNALGLVRDSQHWLALTGGMDHRAAQLMEFRNPSMAIAGDIELPDAKAI